MLISLYPKQISNVSFHFISFHKIKGINLNAVLSGIDSLPSINPPSTPEELVAHYNDGLRGILDALATL